MGFSVIMLSRARLGGNWTGVVENGWSAKVNRAPLSAYTHPTPLHVVVLLAEGVLGTEGSDCSYSGPPLATDSGVRDPISMLNNILRAAQSRGVLMHTYKTQEQHQAADPESTASHTPVMHRPCPELSQLPDLHTLDQGDQCHLIRKHHQRALMYVPHV